MFERSIIDELMEDLDSSDDISTSNIKSWFKMNKPNAYTDEELTLLLDEQECVTKNSSLISHKILTSHLFVNYTKHYPSNEQKIHNQISFNDYMKAYNIANGDIGKMKYKGALFNTAQCEIIPIRPFFDIDKLTDELTADNILNCLNELFINQRIERNNISIAECVKMINGKPSYGYHIVVNNISTTISDLKQLVKYYNTNNNNLFDEAIYAGNRVFRLPLSVNSEKTMPYLIKLGSINDWELDNVDGCIKYILPSIIYEIENIKSHNQMSKNINEKMMNWEIKRAWSEYNFDHVDIDIKIKLFAKFVESPNGCTIHNNRNGMIDNKLYLSTYVLMQLLYYTVSVSIAKSLNQFNASRANINNKFKECCELFDKILTPKAKSQGTLYEQAIKNKYINVVYDDCYLYRVIEHYNKNIYTDFLLYLNNIKMESFVDRDSKTHPFLTSNYTFEDYYNEQDDFQTINDHIHALSKCVATLSNKQYFKFKTLVNNRIKYETKHINDISRIYTSSILIVEQNNKSLDVSSLPAQISETFDKTKTREREMFHEKENQKVKHAMHSIMLHDLLNYCNRIKALKMFGDEKSFVDLEYDIRSNGDLVERNIEHDKHALTNETLTENANYKTMNVKKPFKAFNKDIKKPTLGLFIPPMKTDYDDSVAQEWIKFMMKRIRPKYHNAFIDFLYSLRYRLITGEPTPAKFYVAFGKYGGEGKSFLSACMRLLFGDEAYMVVNREQYADKFDSYKKRLGFICIEEAESADKTLDTRFATALKLQTTPNGSVRGMGRENELVTNYAITLVNTNQYRLNGLVYAEKPVLDRLVVINFAKPNASDEEWEDAKRLAIKDADFAYNLWRYLVSNDGFIKYEGKDYKYSSERYYGKEKDEYVTNAVNKIDKIAAEIASKARYVNEVYDSFCDDIDEDDSKDVNRILEYCPSLNMSYVDFKTIDHHFNTYIKLANNKKVNRRMVDDVMIKLGWRWSDYIKLSNGSHIKGYYKMHEHDSMMQEANRVEELYNEKESHEIEKTKNINTFKVVSKLINNCLESMNEKYSYITIKDIKAASKNEFGISKNNIVETLGYIDFDTKPFSTSINKKSVLLLKYMGKKIVEKSIILDKLSNVLNVNEQ